MTEPSSPSAVPRTTTHGFLFADLRDYSAYADRHGDDAAAELLARYRAIVRDIISRHDGAEIRTEGDSFYVVFPSASAAVRCGMEVLDAARAAEPPIAVGIGVHAGETAETGEGPVGTAVNIAARVCGQARAGELLVTETVRSLTRSRLQFRFVPRGSPTLKGIAEPIALYSVVSADHPEAAALDAGRPAAPALTTIAPRQAGASRRSLVLLLVASFIVVVIAASGIALGVLRSPSGAGPSTLPSGSAPLAVSAAPIQTPGPSAAAGSEPALGNLPLVWKKGGPKQAAIGTYWPAIDPTTGLVWVASPFDDKYWIFEPNGKFVDAWGRPGSGRGELALTTRDPRPDGIGAIAFAPDGSFYVADGGNYRIEKFDTNRRFVKAWGSFGTGDGQFGSPKGIATDGKVVYVADDPRGDIQVFDTNGTFLRKFPFPFVLFSLGPDGHLFAGSDDQGVAVSEFDGNGKKVASYPVSAEDLDGGGLGQALADKAGHVYALVNGRTEGSPQRLIEYAPDGTVINRWSVGGETGAISPDGSAIYFADMDIPGTGWSYIQKYDLPVGVPTYQADPARTGQMPGPGPLGPPRVEWDVALGGRVQGSPAVTGGIVYIGDGAGNITASDETTGRAEWSKSVGSPILGGVCAAGGLVFVGADDGRLTAFDAATGAVRWQYLTKGKVRPSPVVVGGTLFVGSANGSVYAIEASSGKVRWTYQASGGVSRSVAVAGGIVYVPSDGGTLIALDAAKGTKRGSWPLGSGDLSTPVVADGVVYESTGLDDGQARHALVAIDVSSGDIRWRYSTDSNATIFGGALANGTLYVGSGEDNGLHAIDAASGTQKWQFTTEGSNGVRDGVVGQAVYLPSGDRVLYALDTSGQLLWKLPVDGAPGPVAVVDGRVIFGTDLGRLISVAGPVP